MSGKYRTIVADPPWEHPGDGGLSPGWRKNLSYYRAKPLAYPSMTLRELQALPVLDVADTSARLFLWSTSTRMPDALVLLAWWGFEYRQALVWHKPDANPCSGSIAPTAEFLIVGARGKPPRLAKLANAVISHTRTPHSQKPDLFLDLIESVSPGPYLELFARRQRLGWDTWGNEALEHVSLV